MRWWPVPGARCGCAAGDTGLTGVGLSIGQSRHSSTLRASEVQVQMAVVAGGEVVLLVARW